VQRRLDRLSTLGLELFITEFDVGWDDDVVRADWFEDAVRAYFAHPGLSGLILWGFWRERQRYKNEYLIYGEDLKVI
jgi:endo-1,4-beta-xylanase